jgi:2-oxoglutarate dehydrogenase E1 component
MRNLQLVGESASHAQPESRATPDVAIAHGLTATAQAFVEAYRAHGYRLASLDPLEERRLPRKPIAELEPRVYGLSAHDDAPYSVELGGTVQTLRLPELFARLQSSYCATLTINAAHVRAIERRRWLFAQIEAASDGALDDTDALRILEQLAAAEAFEQFHRATYPKHKQFGLEGSETLVPLLVAIIETAARDGVEDIVLAMAHRGRLNVMRNVMGFPVAQLHALFDGAACDLKDHIGCSTVTRTRFGDVALQLAHNPSHLGSVVPVVCGMARALQDRKATRLVLPLLVHGDAAFCAQGIVAETFNFAQTRGYGTGGALHVIVNNRIGSTIANPRDARSTLHSADLARAVDAPIVHVNADDAEAVVAAARLATRYRMRFGADIVIDHVGYRRHGHFGREDPTMTQPALQRRIRRHRTAATLYADALVGRGIARPGDVERLKDAATATLARSLAPPAPPSNPPSAASETPVITAVPLAEPGSILQRMASVPPNFVPHADIRTMLEHWQAVARDPNMPADWMLAENLAYATLLANGYNVRLTGLDVGRGSFFHRNHVWHDQSETADGAGEYLPLRHVGRVQGYFSIFESPLSEEAVVGFEYGYALQCGRDLVVWEAQFGDFVNNAQVIIDQYVASGEGKWGYRSGLTVLLPHGYEGHGAEHSSAYLGRFLQLCADGNMNVAMPSTASQLYHLLRRQALAGERRPLVVMTPKTALYGERASYSSLAELAAGAFHPLIAERASDSVVRAIVVAGKLHYDLAAEREARRRDDCAILRVEQLYPFPTSALADALRRWPRLTEVVWAQEETKNHGAWHLVREWLEAALPRNVSLRYAGRPAAAPSAGCNAKQHAAEQRAIVESAVG